MGLAAQQGLAGWPASILADRACSLPTYSASLDHTADQVHLLLFSSCSCVLPFK